ncbi:MAG TPA: glycosyltransferase family 4 protein [Solirubrobacteraceae bacterium]|nr:glycosyltransferase family 4 protein [Solirubrobacteraceae bacterium]
MAGARGRLRRLLGERAGSRAGGAGAAARSLAELARLGPAPLLPGGTDVNAAMSVAAVVPSFRRGSGGHRTLARLLEALRERGHVVSAWLHDSEGRHAHEPPALTARAFARFFDAPELELHTSFADWRGADVVMATGWQTVSRMLLLPGCRARAYLVQDHEPDFYGASAEALWAAESYGLGLHCIAASPWLAQLLRERYRASASHFDLAVDHDVYRPSDASRREDLVVFYARAVTPRRAVPLGLLALEELARRRPEIELALYGEDRELAAGFAHRNLGVLDDRALAALYGEATVGMVLSLTNPSLGCLEMMASGLPCVELASEPMLACFGAAGPLQLAQPHPLALCEAIETLLEDRARRADRARAGLAFVAERTWERAAGQVEAGLRTALAGDGGRAG